MPARQPLVVERIEQHRERPLATPNDRLGVHLERRKGHATDHD